MKTQAFNRRIMGHVLLIVTMMLGTLALPAEYVQAAGSVSLTTLGAAYTQNFDTLSNVAGSTTNVISINGWDLTETGGGARDNEQYAVDTGGSTTGDTYSYGAAASTDRALGELRSGTLIPVFGASFTNNTGSAISTLDIAYTGEEWRLGTAARTDQFSFEYSANATGLTTGTWTNVAALNFVAPDTATVGAKNGNAAGERTALSSTISGLNIPNGATFWIRWTDLDASGADDGLAIDDFSLTPNNVVTPNLTINDVALSEGNAGTTSFTFTVSLSAPAGPGGVTFDIATANGTASAPGDYTAKSLTGQTIPAGSSTYSFTVLANGDTTPETNETFFANVTNVTNALVIDGQGQGTIVNDEMSKIHDVQGNGAATPIPGATVSVEGVVVANFQGTNKLQGFFLQEEDADADADPATSEGVLIFCGSCPTAVAEGQRVRATGAVSEFNNMTEITASSAGSVVVTDGGNHLAELTSSPIDLPVAGTIDDFYEAREGMLVTFVDPLTVSEYNDLGRYGQIELYEGGRPQQYTETSAPSVAGYTAHLGNLARRRVILDDDNNAQQAYLSQPDGSQFIHYPRPNGGLSVGTQGSDFFRGGDLVSGLTGVLHWSFPGFGADTWRIRPTAARPTSFTAANPRPLTPPAVGGAIKAVGMNLLNYFTTIDTTSSSSTGPCGPSGTLDCRGADSVAELNRQRERASVAICSLNADLYAFMELENTTPSTSINDLLGAVNARCGGAHPYAFVNTGGTLGSDAIRVQQIYRTGILSPVGAPLLDLDPVHNRPPTAQTFDVVDPANPAFGQRFTVIANHFKSKGCPGTGADADTGDGQGCFNATRTAQAARLLSWISGTVLPAAGDPDILLLGDFNSYAHEDPITTITSGGYTDLASALLGQASYSYLFDGQLGHLDYAFASTGLAARVTGIGNWHINADEVPLFDYNDEIKDPGETTFEEKPDGSALVPPRVMFQPASPYRASDHDPVIVGLFQVADLAVTKVDTPDPVAAGDNLTYTITVNNAGPDAADAASLSDSLPAETTFVSLASAGGWSCTTPAVGAGGAVSCSIPSLPVGSTGLTLVVSVNAAVPAGTVLSNTATVASTAGDSDPTNNSSTATTTVIDTTTPTVTIDQAAGQADPASSTPVNFQVVFSEAVTGFSNADVTLSGTANPTTAVVTGGPATYNVAVSGMTTSGTVIASIPAQVASDAAGNANAASTSTDNIMTYLHSAPPVITEGTSVDVTISVNSNPTPFALTLHATDSNFDPLTWRIVTPAAAGIASVGATTGIVAYTPVLNYSGADLFVVEVSDGNGGTDSITVNVTISATRYTVFFPLVERSGMPDLAVNVSISPDKQQFRAGEPVAIQATVTNNGDATASAFWVDLYLNPSSPPAAANQIWNTRCNLTPCFGMAWYVPNGLAPGQSITLSSQSPASGYSIWHGWFAAGTSDLYVYVDSYNPGVAAGAVAELNESNNRAELHGLSVAGANPLQVQLGTLDQLRPRSRSAKN